MNGWTDFKKRNVVYTCNGILFSLTKEGNPEICDDMVLCWAKQASHRRINTTWFHSCEVCNIVKFTEPKSGMVVIRGWGLGH